MKSKRISEVRAVFCSLYPIQYPTVCESHALSVLASCIQKKYNLSEEQINIIDMMTFSQRMDTDLEVLISSHHPIFLTVSVNYGCFSYLSSLYPKLQRLLSLSNYITVFGGPIPTYIPDLFLELDKSSVVIRGEGDEAIIEIFDHWVNDRSFEGIPNISYFTGSKVKHEERLLVNIFKTPSPYREHIDVVLSKRGQVFAEASRGCSWGACSFCIRGLSDVRGNCDEYRRFPVHRIITDLKKLQDKGVNTITFADEDFLGGTLEQCNSFVSDLETQILKNHISFNFDISLTVHSVYSSKWSESQVEHRKSLVEKLKRLGLKKVFLGVESGCDSQLRRYRKGHSSKDAAIAVEILRSLDISTEIGFIMFDPLCSLDEIRENVYFLKTHKLVGLVSSLSNELRLQINSRYIVNLKKAEEKLGKPLYSSNPDFDTLCYSYNYVHFDVELLVTMVRRWNTHMTELHYPLKSLSRYGSGGLLECVSTRIKALLSLIREVYLERLLEAINVLQCQGEIPEEFYNVFLLDMKDFSIQVLQIFSDAPQEVIENSIVEVMLENAQKLVN